MANEAQRLIAVSLGKISSSKGQRGGVNLRRNLLVANVIMKARTVYMMTNYHKVSQTKQIADSDSDNNVEVDTCAISTDESSSTATRNSDCVTSITENTTIYVEEIRVANECAEKENMVCAEKENMVDTRTIAETPAYADDTDNSKYTGTTTTSTNFARCTTKRRLSDVDSPPNALAESNSSNDCDNRGRVHKRARVESSHTNTNTNDSIEDMQTDNVHISNLVNRFSEGFSGLLSLHGRTHTDNASGNVVCSTGSSHSDGFISCSTQIKDAYEAIAVPATPIALAV